VETQHELALWLIASLHPACNSLQTSQQIFNQHASSNLNIITVLTTLLLLWLHLYVGFLFNQPSFQSYTRFSHNLQMLISWIAGIWFIYELDVSVSHWTASKHSNRWNTTVHIGNGCTAVQLNCCAMGSSNTIIRNKYHVLILTTCHFVLTGLKYCNNNTHSILYLTVSSFKQLQTGTSWQKTYWHLCKVYLFYLC